MHAIEFDELSKVFQGKKKVTVNALNSLSLQVAQGEVFGFLGPNGAGKSTSIKILLGLIGSTAGTARIMGVDVTEKSARSDVGFLPENPSFYDFLTGEEYLRFVGKSFNMSAADISAGSSDVLKRLDLWEARKRPIRGYSKGMVQRLGLAQTLIHDPSVYVLDEPMSGLDPIGRALVKDIIRELKERGKTVFFSTHITADVEAVCDRVGVINKGVLLAVDTVSGVLERGVEGYTVRVLKPDGASEERVVAKADLQEFIEKSMAQRWAIERVEPKRKDMEAFFLEMVSPKQTSG
ncbi:ABC transporter ATP-binding protein [Geomonas azotofigens]|uniref:ABC transporter ATP-binding protein n=1 Tax=Geomonas azotofigens TaxID=2843196 RepID=UPI001C12041A|nr:ABC transporter ATP-binding protein [Geomonas azotofigens]MBU5612564.1 ABC transporter ATP-binding protein [Geomonas azotofigens]